MTRSLKVIVSFIFAVTGSTAVWADCSTLPSQSALKSALVSAVAAETSGLNLNMWATIVDRDGIVCAVAFSGVDRGAQRHHRFRRSTVSPRPR